MKKRVKVSEKIGTNCFKTVKIWQILMKIVSGTECDRDKLFFDTERGGQWDQVGHKVETERDLKMSKSGSITRKFPATFKHWSKPPHPHLSTPAYKWLPNSINICFLTKADSSRINFKSAYVLFDIKPSIPNPILLGAAPPVADVVLKNLIILGNITKFCLQESAITFHWGYI